TTLALGCARSAPVTAPTIAFVEGVGGETVLSTSAEASDQGGVSSYRAKDEVEVGGHGSWWPAIVLVPRGGRWLVHCEGYGSDWDEVVGPERIRARHAEVQIESDEEDEGEVAP